MIAPFSLQRYDTYARQLEEGLIDSVRPEQSSVSKDSSGQSVTIATAQNT